MRRILILFLFLAQVSLAWQDGDIIFHQSRSSQSEVIQKVTSSRYTHMGLIVYLDSKPYVLEAIQPVSLTPIQNFIARGVGGHYVVKRLKSKHRVSPQQIEEMKRLAQGLLDRNYDLLFAWNDEEIYCSELVWKLYQRGAGLRLGEPQKFAELDLSAPATQALIKERNGRVDPQELIITPRRMMESKLLEVVDIQPRPSWLGL